MAPKSRQHIIPITYQKAFCDAAPPNGHAADAPFTPFVWLLGIDLDTEPQRKAPNNVLHERNFYTLRSDNPSEPVLEEWLSSTESNYARVLQKLLKGSDLRAEEWRHLLLFVGVLHARTQSQTDLWQQQLGKLEEFTRSIERAHNGREDYSNSQFVGWDEIGKRSIRSRAESFAKVMSQGAVYLFENRTAIPFVTSDTPTALCHIFPDELRSWHFPETLMRSDPDPAKRGFVCFCPLTPTVAIFSSHHCGAPGEITRHETSDHSFVFSLVLFLISSSDSVLLAHKPSPFSPIAADAIRRSRQLAIAADAIDNYVRLIHPQYRFTIEAINIREELEGPVGVLRFRTSDSDQLRAAAAIGSFLECEYRVDGGSKSGMMRNVYFDEIAATASDDSVLRQRM